MNITGFTDEQKHALLDLLIAGMYADRHLASAEDARIQQLLDAFQFPSDHTRQKVTDAAFTRVRRHTASPATVRAYVTQLANSFPAEDGRRRAYDSLGQLLASDDRVTEDERQFLSVVREVFQL